MTYIENIYLCLALPLLLSLFFIRGRSRRYALFLVIGFGLVGVRLLYMQVFHHDFYIQKLSLIHISEPTRP